jgi:hypothetical protein
MEMVLCKLRYLSPTVDLIGTIDLVLYFLARADGISKSLVHHFISLLLQKTSLTTINSFHKDLLLLSSFAVTSAVRSSVLFQNPPMTPSRSCIYAESRCGAHHRRRQDSLKPVLAATARC